MRIPISSSALLKIEYDDKNCFVRSIFALLNPCENSHPSGMADYTQFFNELSNEGFDFSKCTDVYKYEKSKNLSITIFGVNFYQDGIERKHN